MSFPGDSFIKQGASGPGPQAECEQSWSQAVLTWGPQLFLKSDEGIRGKSCAGDA